MKITGVTETQLYDALRLANLTGMAEFDTPDANVCFKRLDPANKRGTVHNVTLTVQNSREYFARRSHTGRRVAAACWHAHFYFLRALFEAVPFARVQTMFADYHGWGDFQALASDTGRRNIGSMASPMRAADACDCLLGVLS